MMDETGESVRSINKRSDDMVQNRVLDALSSGAYLIVHRKINRAVVEGIDDRSENYGVTVSLTRVRKLEKDGVITQVGVDKYASTNSHNSIFS